MSEPVANDAGPSTTAEATSETVPKKDETSNGVSTNDNKKGDRTDQNDRYSLKVKGEYVISERAPSLGPLPAQPDQVPGERSDKRQSGKKKRKGMNKKRPRDARQDDSEKVCMAVLRGEKCPYGDDCKFSHDVKTFMATRKPDIQEVEGGCPNFNTLGYCVYGPMCRLGSIHISKTGENVNKNASDVPGEKPTQPLPINTMNFLPRDVQLQLRKKTYQFSCKRHFEKKEKNSEPTEQEEEGDKQEKVANEPSSSTPVELKTRKIIDFSNKVYIAPLTTVGNLPFRRIMKKFGADITCGEMAVGTCLLEGKPSEWALLKRHPEEDVFGVQIAAAHPDQFSRVAELIENHTNVDFVDLNLGCPLDLVCSKGAGAALMMRDRKLKGALEGISSVLSCPFTVKIRTGWDMNKPFAHQLVPKIQSWGIDGVAAIMVSSN
jgi:tRNA-dihydrouridine synthase 3